jgi:DNA-binding NarL/FixJ family response regulator
VVIIDDWELVRLGTSAVLRALGMAPVAAAAGPELGLAALRAHQPDLVIIGPCAGVAPAALVRRAREASPASIVVVLADTDADRRADADGRPGDHRDAVAAGAAAVARRGGSAADLSALVAIVTGDRPDVAGTDRGRGHDGGAPTEVLLLSTQVAEHRSVA